MRSEIESSGDGNDSTSAGSSNSVLASTEKHYDVGAPKGADGCGASGDRTMSLISSISTDSIDSLCSALSRSDDETILRIGIVGCKRVGRNTLSSRLTAKRLGDYLYSRRNERLEVVVVPTHDEDEGPLESWWTDQSMWSSLDVIILMYSVEDRESFQVLWDMFVPRVKLMSTENPNVIVVGNKLDMVENSRMRRIRRNMVAKPLGEKKALEMGFPCYLECSALTMEGVENIERTIFEMARPVIQHQGCILLQTDRPRSSVIGILGTPGCGRNRLAAALCNRTDYEEKRSSYERSNFVWIGDRYENLNVVVIPTNDKVDPFDPERPWWREKYLLIILLYKICNPQTFVDVMKEWKESFRTYMEEDSIECPPFYLVGNTDIDKDLEKVEPVSSDFLKELALELGIKQFFECSVKNGTGVDKIWKAIEYEMKS